MSNTKKNTIKKRDGESKSGLEGATKLVTWSNFFFDHHSKKNWKNEGEKKKEKAKEK